MKSENVWVAMEAGWRWHCAAILGACVETPESGKTRMDGGKQKRRCSQRHSTVESFEEAESEDSRPSQGN